MNQRMDGQMEGRMLGCWDGGMDGHLAMSEALYRSDQSECQAGKAI